MSETGSPFAGVERPLQATIEDPEAHSLAEERSTSDENANSDEALSIPLRIIKNFATVWYVQTLSSTITLTS